MKEKKGFIITIVILTLLLLGTSSYIVYDKWLKHDIEPKQQKEIKKEKKKPSIRTLTTTEQESLLTQVKDYTTFFADKYPLENISAITNQEALYFAYIQSDVGLNDFMESQLEKTLEKYFGANHPYFHEDIICTLENTPLFVYNSAKREYTFQDTHGHGGVQLYQVEAFYVDGTVEENTIYKVNTHILYGGVRGDTVGPRTAYYSSYEIDDEDLVLSYDDGKDHELTEEEYQKIKNNLPITTFTFQKDKEGNYALENVKIA